MHYRTIQSGGQNIARVYDEGVLLTDSQTALDLIATLSFEAGLSRIIVDKACVSEDFFRLVTGVAGEVAQKMVNYRCKLAIVGDFSKYASANLQAFLLESNRGGHLFFVATDEEAVEKLSKAP